MTPQELKASILQLAIQGKLVEQRPEEGSGGELLEKIAAEKGLKGSKRSKGCSRYIPSIPTISSISSAASVRFIALYSTLRSTAE